MDKNDIIERYVNGVSSLKIEPTNACNSRCVFCAYDKMSRPQQHLDFDIFMKVAEDLDVANISLVMLSPVVGEVLLDPYYEGRVKVLWSRDVAVNSFSNIFTLHRFSTARLDVLLGMLHSLTISMAPNPAAHDSLFRKGGFDKVLQGLRMLAELSHKHVGKVFAQVRASLEDNELHSEAAALFANSAIAVDRQTFPYSNWAGAVSTIPGLVNIHEQVAERTDWPCKWALRPVVFSSAKVGFCPRVDYDAELVIGDLMADGLQDIISSPKRRKYIEAFFRDGGPEYCRRCTAYDPYAGETY